MTPTRQPHRRGFTLLELVVTMGVMSVLMGGLASAILLASHAMPGRESPVAAAIEGIEVAEQIAAELYCAVTFAERSPAAVEFTVPDRDADANPETIRYGWSGTAGDPLTRQYNGSVASDVAENVYEFDLTYDTRSVSGTDRLSAVGIVLRIGGEPSARVSTSVQILNQPEVTAP